ncbi:hypothetical protein BH11BAC3_BH11BAC3_45350 [soil metagenome]
MDKTLINKYGEEILCCRLRTARQKQRMQYEDFDKQLRKLYKEERALCWEIKNLGWEPLVPAVQKGWVRLFVLREDVARTKHAEFFEGILKKINTFQYDWKKDFKKKKRKWGRKIYVARDQYLLMPGEYCFKQLNFSEEESQFFYEQWNVDRYGKWTKQYVFTEPWRFVLRIKPNMIDKVKKIDGELERKLQEIKNYIWSNGLRWRQGRQVHGHYQWTGRDRTEKEKEVSLYKGKSLVQMLDLVREGS